MTTANTPTGGHETRHGNSRRCTRLDAPVGALVLSVLLAAVATIPHQAHAAPFDGAWGVVQDCPTAPDGARGYKWSYDVVVKDGNLVGEYGTKGKPASQTLTGTVASDGSARLAATGLAGDADRTLGFQQPGTRFYFTVEARFSGNKGTGSRTSGRTCIFTFTKK